MAWREFVASVVDSLAWPASAVVIVALLRRQLAALLQSPLSRLRAGPVELERVREAEKVGENVAALKCPAGGHDGGS